MGTGDRRGIRRWSESAVMTSSFDEIAGSLAKIGAPDSLEALGRLVENSEGVTRLQADFARAVIAYRHGIKGLVCRGQLLRFLPSDR